MRVDRCVEPRIQEGLYKTEGGKICSEFDENLTVLKRYEHTTCSTESQRPDMLLCSQFLSVVWHKQYSLILVHVFI
jgi:hypothetical protein